MSTGTGTGTAGSSHIPDTSLMEEKRRDSETVIAPYTAPGSILTIPIPSKFKLRLAKITAKLDILHEFIMDVQAVV